MELNISKKKVQKSSCPIPDTGYWMGNEILIGIMLKFDLKTCLLKFYQKVLLNSE